MPKFMEERLEEAAEKKGYSGRREDAYVYGTMNKLGMMHGNKITAKGKAAQKKHDEDERKGKGSAVHAMMKRRKRG
jgi:hypothetical protein